MKKGREYKEDLQEIIQYLLENKYELVFRNNYELLKSSEVQLIKEINDFEHRSQVVGLKTKIKQISHYFSGNDPFGFGKTLVIKAYCFILLSCISSNLHLEGKQYLKNLIALLNSSSEIQKSLYFIFGLKSIQSLRTYQTIDNKEYKYNLMTQTLFYLILSLIQKKDSVQLRKQFIKNVSQLGACHFNDKFFQAIQNQGENIKCDYLTDQILVEFSKKEQQAKTKKKGHEQTAQILQSLVLAKNRCKKFVPLYNSVMKLKGKPHFQMILQHLKQTNLVKQIREEITERNSSCFNWRKSISENERKTQSAFSYRSDTFNKGSNES